MTLLKPIDYSLLHVRPHGGEPSLDPRSGEKTLEPVRFAASIQRPNRTAQYRAAKTTDTTTEHAASQPRAPLAAPVPPASLFSHGAPTVANKIAVCAGPSI